MNHDYILRDTHGTGIFVSFTSRADKGGGVKDEGGAEPCRLQLRLASRRRHYWHVHLFHDLLVLSSHAEHIFTPTRHHASGIYMYLVEYSAVCLMRCR